MKCVHEVCWKAVPVKARDPFAQNEQRLKAKENVRTVLSFSLGVEASPMHCARSADARLRCQQHGQGFSGWGLGPMSEWFLCVSLPT